MRWLFTFVFNEHRWRWATFPTSDGLNAGVPQGSILRPILFFLTIMTFLMILSLILLSVLMILSRVYSKCDQASDLWQQLQLASELEFDLRDTANDFYDGETSSRIFYRQPQVRYIHDYRLLTNLPGGGCLNFAWRRETCSE